LTDADVRASRVQTSVLRPILVGAFFLSGLTALAAEVILARILGYVFGASHEATATVLAAYMSGLSAGAYLFGRWTSRLRKPIFVYALLELFVALFYCAIPASYVTFRAFGVSVATSLSTQPIPLTVARFALSFAFVFGPTLLMGGTLPVLMSAPVMRDRLRGQLPLLYSANTLGAAVGALTASYRLIPSMGLDGTLFLCALINVTLAGVAYLISAGVEREPSNAADDDDAAEEATSHDERSWLPHRVVFVLAFLQGVLVFVLEVVWTHLIGTVLGVTVYAFAVMLTVILLGIGSGSAAIGAIRRRFNLSPLGLFVTAEIGLALTTTLSLPFWDRFPLVINLALGLRPDWSFAPRELVRFLYTLVLLLPSTFCIGLALPSLIASGSDEDVARRRAGRWVGGALAANTVGAIVGSVVCGFILLGRIGSPAILHGAATLAFALAILAVLTTCGARPVSKHTLVSAATVLIAGGFLLPRWDPARLTAGTHVYWQRWPLPEKGTLLSFAEDAKIGFVTVERKPDGVLLMATNGKYESSNGVSEFQDLLSILGGIYARGFHRVFLLGLGAGRNVALLREMPFEHIDVAEFSPAVVDAARKYYPEFVGSDAPNDRVHIAVDDGRNYLQMLNGKADVVMIALSSAAYAGSGNLYNRDFFEIARAHMQPGGVFVLWLQFHHLHERVIRSTLYTLRQVFPYIHLYTTPSGAQSFLVASPAPLRIDPANAEDFGAGPHVRRVLSVLRFPSLIYVAALNVFSTDAEIQAYVGSPHPRTYNDLDPGFEYEAAQGLALPLLGLDLQPRSAHVTPQFDPPLHEADALGLRGLQQAARGDTAAAVDSLRAAQALVGQPVWNRQITELSAPH
jgi:spermidine synthase